MSCVAPKNEDKPFFVIWGNPLFSEFNRNKNWCISEEKHVTESTNTPYKYSVGRILNHIFILVANRTQSVENRICVGVFGDRSGGSRVMPRPCASLKVVGSRKTFLYCF